MPDGDNYVLLVTDGGPNCNSSLVCDMGECCLNLDQQCQDWETGNCCETEGTRNWCVDHADTRARIEALADRGIKTIVVALPGTEPYTDWLNGFAEAGGAVAPAGQYFYEAYPRDEQEALTQMFADVTEDWINDCIVQLSPTPDAMLPVGPVNVALDCKLVPPGPGQDNWFVDDSTDPPRITFRGGEYCQLLQQGDHRVDVVFGCPTVL